MLNLGCATATTPLAVNIDFNRRMQAKASGVGQVVARLTGRDWSEFREVRYHDLRKGIPFPQDSVDVVYHSHVLEHIDREHVDGFMAEIRRVLRPGGIHRIVVPDLEPHVRAIVADLDEHDAGGVVSGRDHETHIAGALEQSVRRVPGGLRAASPVRRRIEMAIFGDARRVGQTHQWMWTRLSLAQLLEASGFVDVRLVDATTSRILDWSSYGLDVTDEGERHDDSLYMEAVAR